MNREVTSVSRESYLFITSLLASLSVVLHLFRIPYPLMQALKFDLVGLPLLIIAYYSYTHFFLAIPVVWIGIALISQDWIGASMKVLAETTTIIPFILILKRGINKKSIVMISIALGTLSRVISMTIANYIVLPRWALLVGWVSTFEEGLYLVKVTTPFIISFNAILAIAVCSIGYLSIKIARKTGLL